jgi:hypothetical protein
MQRHHFAVIFLLIFLQAVMYPAAMFALYVETGSSGESKSLPVDFPDNGNASFFGFSNNEEEKHVEKSGLHTDDFCLELNFAAVVGLNISSDRLSHSGILAHAEDTSPPPEQA